MSLVDPISYWKAHYLDASAAVKLVIEEAGSSNIKRYFFGDRAGFFITSLSLAEALGVFKRKLFYDETTKKNYFDACYLLLALVRGKPKGIHIDEIDLSNMEVFKQAEDLSHQHHIDLSDSFQIVAVKNGRFRHHVGESKTILITADGQLEFAARIEGLRVWNCKETANPPNQ